MAYSDENEVGGVGEKRAWSEPRLIELKFERTAGKYNKDTVERVNQTIPYAPS